MVLKKGKDEEDDLSQEPYPSPRFFTKPGEQVYLEALNVAVKKFQFHAYLTDQRLFLIDVVEKKVKATAKDIPIDSIEGCIVEVSPNQDPVLVLSLRQDDDEIKPLKITFVQKGNDRSAETDAWVATISGETPVPAHEPEEEIEEEPEYEPEPEPEVRHQPPPAKSRPVVIPQPRQGPPSSQRTPEPRTRVVPQKESQAGYAPYPVSREKPPAQRSSGQPQPSRTFGVPQPVPRDAGTNGSTGRLPQQAPRVRSQEPGSPGRKLEIDTTMKTAMRTAMQPLKQPPLQPLRHAPVEPLRDRQEKPASARYTEKEDYSHGEHEETRSDDEGQPDTIFCYNCGRKVLKIANFCPSCGTRQMHPKEGAQKGTSREASPAHRSPAPPVQRNPPPARYEDSRDDEEDEGEYPEERQSRSNSPQHKKPLKKSPDSTILHKFMRK
ncbi:MAG: hypothetical protein ABFC24_12660 [Methanoregulaceae archaeon]